MTRRLLVLSAVLAAFAASSAHADVTLKLTADAAGVARWFSPVTAELKVGRDLTADQFAALTQAGPAVRARMSETGRLAPEVQAWVSHTRDDAPASITVAWAVVNMKADEKRHYELTLSPAGPTPKIVSFAFKPTDSGRALALGDRPVWLHFTPTYDPANHHDTYKHFHHVAGYHGEGFITKGPGGRYTHHRGLYIGWSKTRTPDGSFDTWHCSNGVSLRHDRYLEAHEFAGPVAARSVSVANWCDKEGKPIVVETRGVTTWSAWHAAGGRTLMDFHFKLESARGDITLDGDPQHAGFQFRAVDSVNQTKATYVRPASAKDRGGDVWADCPWVANQFEVEGNPYAVMHLDHPQNPGTKSGETVYSTRNYGRFGSYAKHELKAGEPLEFRYRVLVFDPKGYEATSVEHFDGVYAGWVKGVEVKVGK